MVIQVNLAWLFRSIFSRDALVQAMSMHLTLHKNDENNKKTEQTYLLSVKIGANRR